jgi:hypothetical protein
MPSGDGTGPRGMGSGTGRGKGWCRTGSRFAAIGQTAFRGRNRWLLGLAAPVIAAAVRDLVNPQGLLRQFARKILTYKKHGVRAVPPKAEYTVLEDNSDTTTKPKEVR